MKRLEETFNTYSDSPILECADFFKGGRLRDFASAAPNLTILEIAFQHKVEEDRESPRFEDTVGSFTWTSLRNASFEHLKATENQLIDFYIRHAKTIKEISLCNFYLLQGTLARVLQKMARVLQLEMF